MNERSAAALSTVDDERWDPCQKTAHPAKRWEVIQLEQERRSAFVSFLQNRCRRVDASVAAGPAAHSNHEFVAAARPRSACAVGRATVAFRSPSAADEARRTVARTQLDSGDEDDKQSRDHYHKERCMETETNECRCHPLCTTHLLVAGLR